MKKTSSFLKKIIDYINQPSSTTFMCNKKLPLWKSLFVDLSISIPLGIIFLVTTFCLFIYGFTIIMRINALF